VPLHSSYSSSPLSLHTLFLLFSSISSLSSGLFVSFYFFSFPFYLSPSSHTS
jgi:hypothetical protein